MIVNQGVSVIGIGSTQSTRAAVLDQARQRRTAETLQWASRAPGVATVSRTGVVTGLTAGTAVVVAAAQAGRFGGRHGHCRVTVSRDLRTMTTELAGPGSGFVSVVGRATNSCSKLPGAGPAACTVSASLGEVVILTATEQWRGSTGGWGRVQARKIPVW